MITACPQFSVIFCPITRARMSVDPPGANGTMILIGLSGYLSAGDCAPALLATKTAAAPNTIVRIATTHLATNRFATSYLLLRSRPDDDGSRLFSAGRGRAIVSDSGASARRSASFEPYCTGARTRPICPKLKHIVSKLETGLRHGPPALHRGFR